MYHRSIHSVSRFHPNHSNQDKRGIIGRADERGSLQFLSTMRDNWEIIRRTNSPQLSGIRLDYFLRSFQRWDGRAFNDKSAVEVAEKGIPNGYGFPGRRAAVAAITS